MDKKVPQGWWDVEAQLEKKKKELGEEEQERRVNERMRIFQERTLKDAEEQREKDKIEAQKKLENLERRMELGEEEEIASIADNDYVIHGPSLREIEEMKESGWGGPTTVFKDVRIVDAQREFAASKEKRKVVLSSEKLMEVDGGDKPSTEDEEEQEKIKGKWAEYERKKKQEEEDKEEERCTSYEEDEDEDEEQQEKEQKKEQEQEKDKKEEKDSEDEEDGKWGDVWEEMYGGMEHSIEEDAELVTQFAKEGGIDVESASQSVTMVAKLIRRIKDFREEREKEEEENKDESKEEEKGESRRERKREKETERKNRSRSRRDPSAEKRSTRPSSRQVKKSPSPMEDE